MHSIRRACVRLVDCVNDMSSELSLMFFLVFQQILQFPMLPTDENDNVSHVSMVGEVSAIL